MKMRKRKRSERLALPSCGEAISSRGWRPPKFGGHLMHPSRSNRRVHSSEFKAQVISKCRQPGASVAAVSIAHGLNPNVVRKWLAGHGLKRMGDSVPAPTAQTPALQFIPVKLTEPVHRCAPAADAPGDIRIELERGALQLKLHCAVSAGPAYAALLRALADTMLVV